MKVFKGFIIIKYNFYIIKCLYIIYLYNNICNYIYYYNKGDIV